MNKTILIDFDGVIHSYTSGWQGLTKIPDPPVDGALKFLVELYDQGYQPCIYSSRSKSWFGRRAMKKWLERKISEEIGLIDLVLNPYTWQLKVIACHQSMDPWEIHVVDAVHKFVYHILKFPSRKPAAYLTIDDRAICFNGTFPTMDEIEKLKPWYQKENPIGK